MPNLRVFTLNVWGMPGPFLCKKREERIAALGNDLGKGEYDIVLLQEVWQKSNYKTLAEKICPVMPYTHYFYSGMVGSGICLFSKGPIHDIQFFSFQLNGHAHKLQHGDWFGGKGVGLCKIEYLGLKINVFTAHLHAEYNRINDEYYSHRISQSFELSQVVKLTSDGNCDLVILGGDLNLEPEDLGFKIIKANASLKDSWLEKKCVLNGSNIGNTCSVPTNSFTTTGDMKYCPDGKRIDYILYRPGKGLEVSCDQCLNPLDKIPEVGCSYSDHEAVASVFNIKTSNDSKIEHSNQKADLKMYLKDAIAILDAGLVKITRARTMFATFFVLSLVILWMIASNYFTPRGLEILIEIFRILVIVFGFYSLWSSVVLNQSEINGHKQIRMCMINLLGQLDDEKKIF